jgi:hypothetical protein
MTHDDAALLLASTNQPNGTFLVTMGPTPTYATVSVVVDRAVRQVAISRRLPRGFMAFHPVTGEQEDFSVGREFIAANRHVFRFNFAANGVPELDFASDWPKEYIQLESPADDRGGGSFSFGDRLFGIVTSTYPESSGGWSTVCDHVAANLFPTRSLMVLCDGCGFGGRSRSAAIAASRAFLSFMRAFQFRAYDTEDFCKGLLCSVAVAHDAVLASNEVPEDAGTTTMLGAAVVRLDAREPEKWALLIVSIGDVKCFVWRDGRMLDATFGNRGNVSDATDPGGRIGPRVEKTHPDLRNLKCYFQPLRENDIVVLMSDGVHDNFDPETNGNMAPSLLSDKVREGTKWSDMKPDDAMALKSSWACDFMSRVLQPLGAAMTPESLCSTLASFCVSNTQSSRAFMADNPYKRLPSDYTLYPGKMDHTSLIAMRVGERIELPEERVTDVASFQPELLGRFLHFDSSPATSPPGSPASPGMRAVERKLCGDPAELERFREHLSRENVPRGERLVLLLVALCEYNGLASDDDRRNKAESIIETFLSESSPLLTDDRVGAQARQAVKAYARTSSVKLSGRGMSKTSPFATMFEKLHSKVVGCVEGMYVEYEKKASGRFLLSSSPSSSKDGGWPLTSSGTSVGGTNATANAAAALMRTMGSGSGSSSVISSGNSNNAPEVSSASMSSSGRRTPGELNPLDLRLPTFEQMLKNSFTRQKVLAFGTTLGYETCLRFLGLERDYRREVHEMERRVMFANQIYNHFVSSSSPSPIKVSLRVRRALKAQLETKKIEQPPLDLFAEAVAEVTEWLQAEFYPQLIANDQFMTLCDACFATEKLNNEFLKAIASGDDKQALTCLDHGAELDFCDSQGYGGLLSAAWVGNYKLCLELLKRGAYVNQEANDHSNIWHTLAAGPHNDQKEVSFVWTSELRTLLKRINDTAITRPTALNQNKETALHVAVLGRAPMELIRFLCEKCKCPEIREAKNDKGETALNYGTRIHAPTEVLQYLTKK